MAVTISTFTISTEDIFGFIPPAFAGFSDQIGDGTITNGEVVAFGGNGVRGLYWQGSNDRLNFEVYGIHENDGWDYITVNGVNYNRSSATYGGAITFNGTASNNYTKGGIFTSWYWTGVSSFPFASSASGATQAMYVKHSGSKPASGPLSLNTIHTIAGGSSGTSVGLNDSDVRALNWYNTVAGSAIASGGKNAVQEYYYPCNVGENQGDQRRRLFSTTSNDLNYKLSLNDLNYVTRGDFPVTTYLTVGMSIEFDGTDTRLRFWHGNLITNNNTQVITNTLTSQYWNSLTSGTANPVTYSSSANNAILFEGVQVKQAALLTSQHNESIDTGKNANNSNKATAQYNQAQFGFTLMPTNSITSFVDTASGTAYGRAFTINSLLSRFTYSSTTSSVDIRFRWALRLLGYSPADRTFIEKDTTLNFMMSLNTYLQKNV
jgi:hypothetical protein